MKRYIFLVLFLVLISSCSALKSLPKTILNKKDDAEMILIPAGEFTMGNNDLDNTRPSHGVLLRDYYIDKYEVTVKQYKQFLKHVDVDDRTPFMPIGKMPKDYLTNEKYDDYPIININWFSARAYAQWAEKRLPSEAEWEKAARGADIYTWPWGNNFKEKNANLISAIDGYEFLAPVGSFPQGASPYGVMDMCGNAWEWVNDYYRLDYNKKEDTRISKQGIEEHKSRLSEPKFFNTDCKVLRGGGWYSNKETSRCYYRIYAKPNVIDNGYGFRCVKDCF